MAAMAQDRNAWALLSGTLKAEDLTPEGQIIYDLVSRFYDADDKAETCDVEILIARAEREIQSNKNSDIIVRELKKLKETDVSSINVAREFISHRANILGLKIASKLASGKRDPETVSMMTDYMELSEKEDITSDDEEEIQIGVSASDLVKQSFQKEGLIQLWPKSLNEHIDGGLRGGHHVLVFAPTEMGKTLFVLNAVAGFLKQGLRVLYVGNEDPASDLTMRLMTRLTGMTKYEIQSEPGKADEILRRRNWNCFVLANLAPGTFPRIHRLLEKHNSQVLVLDQLRNLDVQSENRTQGLEKAATNARNTARRFNIPVISVTQAGDSASGKTILNRGDVDSSNVGIPGQVDLMIGVGATEEMERRNMRILSFAKNKLSGRHEPLQVVVDPPLSRVIDG